MNLADPYVVARAIGIATPLAIIAFFVARKVGGPSGTAELERLKRTAGISGSEPLSHLRIREWLPWLVAPPTGLMVFAFAAATATPEVLPSVDFPKLRASFVDGCTRRCNANSGDIALCRTICECGFSEMRHRKGSQERLIEWFSAAARDPGLQHEAEAATLACARNITASEQVRSAPAPTAIP